MAVTSLKQFVKDATAFISGGVYNLFGRSTWSKGNLLRVDVDSAGQSSLVSVPLLTMGPIVSTDAQLEDAKTPKFSTVFNTWRRISLQGTSSLFVPAEADSWTYDAATDSVTCTVNSVYLTGFISPEAYDNYTFEVELSSNNGDDDAIGLCLAFQEEDGVPYSLVLYRIAGSGGPSPTPNVSNFPFQIGYNPGAAANNRTLIVAGLSGSLQYPDGTLIGGGTTDGQQTHGGWSSLGAIRVKVERSVSQITVWTTDRSDLTYRPENSLTIDLDSQSYLKRFKLPGKIGYIAHSQPYASFKTIQAPGANAPVYDVRDKSVWLYENRNWIRYPAGDAKVKAAYPKGLLYSSTQEHKTYFSTDDGVLTQIGAY